MKKRYATTKSQKMSIEIRKAILSDAAVIANIYNQYLGVSTMDLIPYTQESVEQTMNNQNDREVYLMLDVDDKSIGWGQIKKYSDRKGYQFACETAIYMDKDHLSKGYGSRFKKSHNSKLQGFQIQTFGR